MSLICSCSGYFMTFDQNGGQAVSGIPTTLNMDQVVVQDLQEYSNNNGVVTMLGSGGLYDISYGINVEKADSNSTPGIDILTEIALNGQVQKASAQYSFLRSGAETKIGTSANLILRAITGDVLSLQATKLTSTSQTIQTIQRAVWLKIIKLANV